MAEPARGVVLGSYHQVDQFMFSADDAMAGRLDRRQGTTYTPRPQLVDSAIRRSILYLDHIQWPRTPQSMPIASGSEYGVLQTQGYQWLTLSRGCLLKRTGAIQVFDMSGGRSRY